jgi:hypothetical protein
MVFDSSPCQHERIIDRSFYPVNLMRVGINPRLALSSRLALPFVRTPDSNEILSENPLAEGCIRESFLQKCWTFAKCGRTHACIINRWLAFLECWLQKHLILIKPNMVLLILTQHGVELVNHSDHRCAIIFRALNRKAMPHSPPLVEEFARFSGETASRPCVLGPIKPANWSDPPRFQ